MQQNRRPIDRYLDRLERLLIKCNEAEKAERKKRRAEQRAQKEKLKRPDEGSAQPGHEDEDTIH